MLNKYGLFSREDDPQSISRSLAIPISRARSLIYDFQLRNTPADDDWFKNECRAVLAHARFYDANKIEFQVVSPLLRNEIAARLVSAKAIVDSSFNGEIIRIRFNEYAALLELISTPEEKDHIEKTLNDILKAEIAKQKAIDKPSGREQLTEFFLKTLKSQGMTFALTKSLTGLGLLGKLIQQSINN